VVRFRSWADCRGFQDSKSAKRLQQAQRAAGLLALSREQRLDAVGAVQKPAVTATPLTVKLNRLPDDYVFRPAADDGSGARNDGKPADGVAESGATTGAGCVSGVNDEGASSAVTGPAGEAVVQRTSKKKTPRKRKAHHFHDAPPVNKRIRAKSHKRRKSKARYLHSAGENGCAEPAVGHPLDSDSCSSAQKSRKHKARRLHDAQENGGHEPATVRAAHHPNSPDNNSALAIPLQNVESLSSAIGAADNLSQSKPAGEGDAGGLSRDEAERNEDEATTATSTAEQSNVAADCGGRENVVSGGSNNQSCSAAADANAGSEAGRHSRPTSSGQDVTGVAGKTRSRRGRPGGRRGARSAVPAETLVQTGVDRGSGLQGYRGGHYASWTEPLHYGTSYDTGMVPLPSTAYTSYAHQFPEATASLPSMHHNPYVPRQPG